MYRDHVVCRACGSRLLVPVFDLGAQPPANDFCIPGEEREGFAPLEVLFCKECGLAQLSVVVNPESLYSHYAYITSDSQTMRSHFHKLARHLAEETGGKGSVLEIGSNDGAFLEFLSEFDFGPVCGIDPALNLAMEAQKRKVETIVGLFDEETAAEALSTLKKIDIVIARHVFCHVDDWKQFMIDLSAITHKNTLVCIEVPWVNDLLTRCEFDTVYHEHTSYMSLNALQHLLRDTMFELSNVIHVAIHGGALLIFLRRKEANLKPAGALFQMLEYENVSAEDWKNFKVRCSMSIAGLKNYVVKLVAEGKTVVGFGASAKSTVWMNACGFTREHIRFITDNTPHKIGRLSPGTRIPIVAEDELSKQQPDYAILFAWNYREEILDKHKAFRAAGGKFIIPVPTIEVV